MAEGTVAHDLGAKCLVGKWDYEKLASFEGVEKAQEEHIITIDEEMIDAVWEYVEIVRSHMRPGAIMIVEKKIWIPEVHDLLFATPDCIIIWPFEKIMAFDLKYGAGKKVSSYENKQLLYYILRYFIDEDVKEIEISIIQPRIGDDHLSTYVVDAAYMEVFHHDLMLAARNALNPKAELVAGDWCHNTFCPVFKTCGTANKKAQALVAKDFDGAPSVDSLTIKQIVKVLDNQDFIKAFITKVVDYAKELAYQGEDIPGWKIVKCKGNRQWSSEDALLADFEVRHGDRMFEAKKLKSPAKMEKIIGKKEVADYAYKPDVGYKLVTLDKGGDPINLIKAEEDFAEEADEL